MKRKDFLHTAIILPVILGLALCVAFSLFFYLRPQTILPFEQGKTFAYFDETEPSGAPYKKNETVGKLEIGSSVFDLKYDADFSQRFHSKKRAISRVKRVAFMPMHLAIRSKPMPLLMKSC